jgi:anti-sigma factor RsiW
MNINRHNYEEFFLLYVDNELSAAERKDVDVFVLQNPDLLPELQLLAQSVLPLDAVSFDNKSGLLKEENFAALQQQLLFYIDNELSDSDKTVLEKTLAADKSFANELSILQQTKQQSGEVSFS